ncbi:MAG TPA: TadE/TadG family type IV pilus assembly protein [Sphingomicrobium sp.]|jgi:Flp pilus assembly protein TadG
MMLRRKLHGDVRGAATIEMAFALPTLIALIWAFVQLAQIYRATAGIQQALGEGARYATLCLNATTTGCTIPSPGTGTNPAANTIKRVIYDSVYGIGPGTFTVPDPSLVTDTTGGGKYYDLTVTYSQPTNLLMFAGPTITVSRSKRVWVATT